jgi:hypothetical protein
LLLSADVIVSFGSMWGRTSGQSGVAVYRALEPR